MKRLPDWRWRLEAFIEANADRKFRYGAWDCCLFVCEAVKAMTGVDMAASFGVYSSRGEALKRIYRSTGTHKVSEIAKVIATAHGMVACGILHAQRGDVAVLSRQHGRDSSLGLIALSGKDILVVTARGLKLVPLGAAVSAFHV